MAAQTHTTTTTNQHWLLEKYSRSRTPVETPTKRIKMSEGGGASGANQGVGEEALEWDHYTQPQLSLRLKTTFSSASSSSSSSHSLQHVQSMVLSISFDPLYREPNRAKQHLTLDSLDLASFSSPAIRDATPRDQLPLKAVYKDAVLGLRYIALDEDDAGGGEGARFKRLQVKFVSQDERERFVEAVQAFVPSKPAVELSPAKSAGGKGKSKVGGGASKTATPRKKKQTTSSPSKQKQPQLPTVLPPLPTPFSTAALLSSAVTNAFLPPPQPQPQPHPTSSFSRLATSSRYNDPLVPILQAEPAAFSRSSTTAPPTQRLPPSLSTLLPNLASSSQALFTPVPSLPTLTPSQQLAQLTPPEFDKLLQEALLEEGFEELVARVQATLRG
ncbi:hypothetical protein JCM8097_005651 [Rhodosporidiobolus ruineniae]